MHADRHDTMSYVSAVTMLIIISVLILIEQGGTQYVSSGLHGDHVNSTAVESVNHTCPHPWSIPESTNGSTEYSCGSDLGKVIHCDGSTLQVSLLPCYCMTSYAKDPNITVVGTCLYSCFHDMGKSDNSLPNCSNTTEVTDYMCNKATVHGKPSWSHRDGQLCGKCKQGFAPPAYSYDRRCVRCSQNKYSIVKYCVVAFLPLTLFFMVLITLRISATSPSMNAFVLACQVLTSPLQIGTSFIHTIDQHANILVKLSASLYGIWNLDFFRTLYPRFCLHPNMSTLQVLALDYIIAAYPLLLIVITYCLVESHDRNCKIVMFLWKPFRRCFIHFYREWDIRTSLIEAFASFLLLSYVKFLSVTFYFLLPVYVYNVHGDPMELYLFFDGTVEYFGKQHLPYAILAIIVLTIFNILPLLLLSLYPCLYFQKILNIYRLNCHSLQILMDAFQGCYKNGVDGTKDCRYLSAVYLLVRILLFVITAILLNFPLVTIYCLTGVLFTIFAILIAVVQPYRSSIYSVIDIVLLLVIALICFFAMGHILTYGEYKHFHRLSSGLVVISGFIPLLYVTVLVLYRLFGKKVPQRLCLSFLSLPFCKRLMIQSTSNSEEPLPDRLANPEECAALLHEPVIDNQDTDDSTDVPFF